MSPLQARLQPGPDVVVQFRQGAKGHLQVICYPARSDIEDTFYLRGLGPGEQPCTFHVRSWLTDVPGGHVDTGRRVATEWRNGEVAGLAASEDVWLDEC